MSLLIDEVTAVESTAEKEGLDAGKIAAQKLGSLMRKYHNKLGVDWDRELFGEGRYAGKISLNWHDTRACNQADSYALVRKFHNVILSAKYI